MILVCYNFLFGKKVIRHSVIKMKLYDELYFPLKDQNFFVHFIRTVFCIFTYFYITAKSLYNVHLCFGNILREKKDSVHAYTFYNMVVITFTISKKEYFFFYSYTIKALLKKVTLIILLKGFLVMPIIV